MKIALDFDDTYTLDPDFWNTFIALAESLGHEVRIVTARDDRFDRTRALVEIEKLVRVIYCRGVAKRWYVTHFGDGFTPDIWIDDNPESILENSSFTPDDLHNWRESRIEGAPQ